MTQHYQIAVIGTQVAGLLAAIKLALAGQRVLVIDDTAEPAGTMLSGYWCEDDSAFAALPNEAELKQFFRTLSINNSDEKSVLWQLLLPERRLDIGKDYIAELQRGFGPEEAKTIDEEALFLKEQAPIVIKTLFHGEKTLFPKGLVASLKYGFKNKELAALPQLKQRAEIPPEYELLKRFLLAKNSGVAVCAAENFPLGSILPLSWPLFPENHYSFKDGRSLRQALLEHFKEVGGEIKKAKVKAVNNKGRLLTSLVFDGKNEELSFEVAILAAHGHDMHRFLAGTGGQKKLAKEEALKNPSFALYRRHYLLKNSVRPEGMAERAIYYFSTPEAAMALPFMAIELRHPAKILKDEPFSLAAPDENVLLITATLLTTYELSMGEEAVLRLDKAIFHALEETIPFLSDFLIDRETGDPRVHFAPRFSMAGELKSALVGLPVDTPFLNAFRAQKSVLPTLGIEGEWQCANIVVSRALQYFRR